MNESSAHISPAARSKIIVRTTMVGLYVNVLLTVAKYLAGIIGHSGAMIADATHSFSDLLTDFAVLLGVHYSNKPADDEHTYGHGRVETLSAAFCGLILFIIGMGILLEGAKSIFHFVVYAKIPKVPGTIALGGAVLSILLKEFLYRYTMYKAKTVGSMSLEANAWHHRTDALSSVGALLGIGGAILGGAKWAILDPIAAVVVSVLILYASAVIFWQSIREVLDTSLAPSQLELINKAALDFGEICNIHKIRTRRIGFYVEVEAHIVMDGDMTLTTTHHVATLLEDKLKELLGPNTLITIHTEPAKMQKKENII